MVQAPQGLVNPAHSVVRSLSSCPCTGRTVSKAAEQQQQEGGDDLDWQFRGSGEQFPISFVDNPPTEAELEEVGLWTACEGSQQYCPTLEPMCCPASAADSRPTGAEPEEVSLLAA